MKNLLALTALILCHDAFSAQIATVNGKPVTDEDVKMALSSLNEAQRDGISKDLNSKKQVLSSVLEQEILLQEATKEKLDQDNDYKNALAAFRKQYLINRTLEKNLRSKMTDSAAKSYYETHKADFSTDQVHAHHILLSDEKKAKQILAEAKAPNADFQALAEKHSQDPSAKNNRGDLGFFGKDQFVPEFTHAAFSASEGEIIGPVQTSFGFHIIKVLKKKVGAPLEYREVELKVKNALWQRLVMTYVGKLKEQAKIQINDQALEKAKFN
jgi:peptidyl-prolyl cis-trans isomerase C